MTHQPTFTGIRPFVPARDFEMSKALYRELGGEITFDYEDQVAGGRFGDDEILVQNRYVKEWAENFMLQIGVRDLSGWAEKLESMAADERFVGLRHKGPVDEPWGQRILYVFEPGGVLVQLVEERG